MSESVYFSSFMAIWSGSVSPSSSTITGAHMLHTKPSTNHWQVFTLYRTETVCPHEKYQSRQCLHYSFPLEDSAQHLRSTSCSLTCFQCPGFDASTKIFFRRHWTCRHVQWFGLPQQLTSLAVISCPALTVLKRHSDAKPLLRQLHWLPVRQRIQYKVAVLTRKVRMTRAPSYLSQHLVQHVATRQTRSMALPLLTIPSTNTEFASVHIHTLHLSSGTVYPATS